MHQRGYLSYELHCKVSNSSLQFKQMNKYLSVLFHYVILIKGNLNLFFEFFVLLRYLVICATLFIYYCIRFVWFKTSLKIFFTKILIVSNLMHHLPIGVACYCTAWKLQVLLLWICFTREFIQNKYFLHASKQCLVSKDISIVHHENKNSFSLFLLYWQVELINFWSFI